jgi:hypothetical protein
VPQASIISINNTKCPTSVKESLVLYRTRQTLETTYNSQENEDEKETDKPREKQ